MSNDSGDKVKRFCPKCGAAVRAPEELFERPQKCPKCANVVQFRDYPNEAAHIPAEEPIEHSPLPKIVLAGLAILFGLVVLVSLGLLVTGNFGGAAILASACLLFAIPAVGLYVDHRRRLDEAHERIEVLAPQVDTYRASAIELQDAYEGFRRNFEAMVNDKRNALEEEWQSRLSDAQDELDRARDMTTSVNTLAARYLKDTLNWITSKLTSKNYHSSHDRLAKVIAYVRKTGFSVSPEEEAEYVAELKRAYEDVLRKEAARQEQAEIRERIREEQRAERELQRELQRIDAERQAVENALAEALQRTHDEHSAEVELLRQKLADAEERATRAQSMAQITKAGNVYVISNFGSFGEDVFKIGMTRRLEPLDRVKELGGASVPFPFDVHMMIACDDAPKLENTLHRDLNNCRVNKVNLRREYFKTNIETIRQIVERNHGEVEYVADPEALERRESLTMTDEDFAFVSSQQTVLAGDDDDDDGDDYE